MALHQLSAEQKQLTISSRVHQELNVRADRNQLEFVLRNLLQNAIKFSHLGGQVIVMATARPGVAEISIMDQGVGLTADQTQAIMRGEAGRSTKGTAGEKGTGLGLAVCREFIEKNGGTLRIETVPGQGTTVAFTLPTR